MLIVDKLELGPGQVHIYKYILNLPNDFHP